MNPGMLRRRTNSTRYDRQAQKVSWRVEWLFTPPGGSVEGGGSAAAAAVAAAEAAEEGEAPPGDGGYEGTDGAQGSGDEAGAEAVHGSGADTLLGGETADEVTPSDLRGQTLAATSMDVDASLPQQAALPSQEGEPPSIPTSLLLSIAPVASSAPVAAAATEATATAAGQDEPSSLDALPATMEERTASGRGDPSSSSSSCAPPLLRLADERVAEDLPLQAVLAEHLRYKLGMGSRHHALREFADAGAERLCVFMRKEDQQVRVDYFWYEEECYIYGMNRRVLFWCATCLLFRFCRPSHPPHPPSSSSSSGQLALLLRRGHVAHPRLTAGRQSHHRVPCLRGVPPGTGEGAQCVCGGGAHPSGRWGSMAEPVRDEG